MTAITSQPAPSVTVPAGPVRQLLGLRPDVDVRSVEDGVELRHRWGGRRLRGLSAASVDRLRALREAPAEPLALGGLAALLPQLGNLVELSLVGPGGAALLIATPVNARACLPDPTDLVAGKVQLSRYAFGRRLPADGDGFVLESPLATHRIRFSDPAAMAFVAALARPLDPDDAPLPGAAAIAAVLRAAGLLETEEDSRYRMWDFHDLLFHSRSRYGSHDYEGGGVYAYPDVTPPASLPPSTAGGVALAVPDWDRVVAADRSLTEVIESRRSARAYGATITVDQLGELLYRAARARAVHLGDGSEHSYDVVDRPYPNGGGMGELELFLSVLRCDGLTPGVYRYDSVDHRLCPLPAVPDLQAQFAANAWLATAGALTEPQVQFAMLSRLGRLQWKYSSIAYSVTLKHVGVLFQNLYLVATAMGLSPCANGSGDSELLSRLTDTDPSELVPVGEFALGGPPAQPTSWVTGFADLRPDDR